MVSDKKVKGGIKMAAFMRDPSDEDTLVFKYKKKRELSLLLSLLSRA